MDVGDIEQIDDLEMRLMESERRKNELNIKLMKTMADLSDAQDALKRYRVELEIVASKGNHNLCHIWIPLLLKNTIGHTGSFPDPDGMTEEEFEQGCNEYRRCIFSAIRAREALKGGKDV